MDAAGGQPAITLEPEFSSPLIDLPSELWVQILKKIPQKDALNLRLVNKDFKEKVNNLYEDWKIMLDENTPFLQMILNLRVKEVQVRCLFDTPSFRPPGILFQYPDLIQKLTLSTYALSTQNAHVLLQSKNLKWISLKLNKNTEPLEALPLIGYNYPDLHTLEIEIVTSEKDKGQFLEPGNLFQRLLMSSTMPKLNSFYFSHHSHNNSDTIYNFSSVLLSFLSRHWQNLQHLHYKSWIFESHSYAEFPPLDYSFLLKNMTSLKTVKLSPYWRVDPLHKTWKRLIQNQKNLVDLDLGYNFDISSIFLREIVCNNFQTLTSVKINCWTFEEGQADGVFDASIFETCHSLTNLKVDPANDRNNPDVVNLLYLPTQIKTLYLVNFRANSGDLLNFLLGQPVLSSLSIRTGGSLPVIEAILTHPALLSVLIKRGIEVPTWQSEMVRLNELFDGLKYRKIFGHFDFHGEFIIKRASAIANWEHERFW